jgi:tRNA U54 and U55 pseudouridine synthase Pus10
MRDRIHQILENHRDKKAKKEYISDEELKKIYAILLTFTSNWEVEKSKFEEVYKELQEAPITDWDDKAIKEQTSKSF